MESSFGHTGSTVIQYYMPEFVGFDLGNASATEFLAVYSHMSLWRDSNAPTELTEAQLFEILTNPKIIECQKGLAQYKSLKNCKTVDSGTHQHFEKMKRDLYNLKRLLQREMFREARSQYFKE